MMSIRRKLTSIYLALSVLIGAFIWLNPLGGVIASASQGSLLVPEDDNWRGYFRNEYHSKFDHPRHNVLPPMYPPGAVGAGNSQNIAIPHYYNIIDVLEDQNNKPGKLPDTLGVNYRLNKDLFIERMVQKTKEAFLKDDSRFVTDVKLCKETPYANMEKEYKPDYEKCKKWIRTGYLFVLATMGEIRKDHPIKVQFAEMLLNPEGYFIKKNVSEGEKKCENKTDPTKKQHCYVDEYFKGIENRIKSVQSGELHQNRFITLTYIGPRHSLEYDGKRMYLEEQNSAILKKTFDEVVTYPHWSAPSPGVIIWQKDGNEPAKPVWVLRLYCANPLGTLLPDNKAEISSQISVDQKTVYLQTGAKKTVKFNYDIFKEAQNQAFNAEYVFSGSAGHFNHQNIKYLSHKLLRHAYGSLGDVPQEDFKTLRSDSGGGKVALGDKFLDMRVKYEETYELDFDKKNWRPISLNKGEVCRTIEARAVGATSVLPPKKQTVCVEIYIGATPPPNATGLYIDSLVPEIASPGYPINELTNGLVTYAIRPKQWEDKSDPKSKGPSSCTKTDPSYPEEIRKECKKKCDDDQENKINCEVINESSNNESCTYTTNTCCNWNKKKKQCDEYCTESGTKYSASGTCTYLKRSTADTNWRVTKFLLYPEDKAVNASMNLDNNEEPCKYYTGRTTGNNCVTQFSGSNQFDSSSIYSIVGGHNPLAGLMRIHITPGSVGGSIPKAIPSSTTGFADSKYDVDNLPTGTKVCFGVSVNQWQIGNSANGNKTIQWAHSKPECFVVSKKPYFSVENGLVVSGGKIITGLNKRKGNNSIAGSATEYAAISGGRISPQFSTSLLLDGSVRVQTADYMNWHRLTLANPDPNDLGSFGKPPEDLIKAIDYFRVRGKSHNGNFVAHQAGVYVVKGKATISGNIVDTKTNKGANSGNPRNIQQMVIIADEIEIKNNVTQIDAWLMTSGVLSTSDHALTDAGVKKAGADESKLVINGPVYAEHIRLRRKYGSGIKSDKNPNNLASGKNQLSEPAERFIDNTDTYIWGYYNSLERGQYQTVYMREVAPRY